MTRRLLNRLVLLIILLLLAILVGQAFLVFDRGRETGAVGSEAALPSIPPSPTVSPRLTYTPTPYGVVAAITPSATPTATPGATSTSTPTATPSPTPTTTPGTAPPTLPRVSVAIANVRAGPGANFPIVGKQLADTALALVGKTAAGDWLAITTSANQPGWIAAELVAGAASDLPVLTPPPTPTPLPPTATPPPLALAAPAAAGQAPVARVPRLVLANYFTWYDTNTWNGCNVSAGDRPQQPYNSDDPETIARQVRQALSAGIDGFTAQWATPGDRTDRNFANVLAKSQGTGFQSTVVFLRHIWPGANTGNTIEAIRYLLTQYAGHPNFLKLNGRPVIFFTDVYRVPRSGGSSPQAAWANIRAQVDPNHNAVWIAEGLDPSFLSVFDGLWVYKVTHASSPNDYGKAPRWASRVRAMENQTGQSKLWVGTVMPGWNDLRAGCRPDVRVPSAPYARDRAGGDFYRATYNAAASSNPDLLWVNSFNEWVEGTYVEPGQAYGDAYLNLTRDLAAQFKAR